MESNRNAMVGALFCIVMSLAAGCGPDGSPRSNTSFVTGTGPNMTSGVDVPSTTAHPTGSGPGTGPSELLNYGQWSFEVPSAGERAKARVTETQAIAAAKNSGIHAEAFSAEGESPLVALAMLTAPPNIEHREVMVVQVTGVPLGYSSPTMRSEPLTSVGTAQWAIDAESGELVMARSFPG